jgi:hypothetical protein
MWQLTYYGFIDSLRFLTMPNLSEDEFNLIRKLLMDLRAIKTSDLDKALAILHKRSKPIDS